MSALTPGQKLARGLSRHLSRQLDCACLPEFSPSRGLRADVMALTPKGEIWLIECKSSRADFTSDKKWQGYLPWCDRFFWAVGPDFPREILPEDSGVFLADAYGAEELCSAPLRPLAPARRKALTLALARQAMARLQALRDPGPEGLLGAP